MPTEVIRTLLDRGTDPNALFRCKLAKRANHYHDLDWSPLSAASRTDNFPVFGLLLERGADINAVGHIGSSTMPNPLFAAAHMLAVGGFGRYARWIRACRDNGADFNLHLLRVAYWRYGVYPADYRHRADHRWSEKKYGFTPLQHFIASVDSSSFWTPARLLDARRTIVATGSRCGLGCSLVRPVVVR